MTDPAVTDPNVPAAPAADQATSPAPQQAPAPTSAPSQPDAPAPVPTAPPQQAASNQNAAPNLGKIEQLSRAGFSDQEVNDFAKNKGSTLLSAGFSQQEVNDYLGVKAPDMAPVRQMVQKNLTEPKVESPEGEEGTEKKEPEAQPSFSQSLDTGMGMPVSKILSGGDAPMSPDMRGHLMNAYANGHAMDAADFMQSAIPAAAQSVWYQKLWHATESFAHEFTETEKQNPLDQDTVDAITGHSQFPTQGSALQRLYGISSYDAAQAVLLAARGGKEILNAFPAAMEGFEAFSNKLGQESGHPDIGKNIGMTPQALMEAFPHLMVGDRPPEISEASFDSSTAARHVGAKISSIIQGGNDLRQMIGEKMNKPASAVTSQDVANTIATSFKAKAPTAEDFINTAIVLLGKDKEQAGAATLRDVYKDTGLPPGQVFADAKANPAMSADLEAGKVPKVYEPLIEKAVEPISTTDTEREVLPPNVHAAARDEALSNAKQDDNEHGVLVDNKTGQKLSSLTSGENKALHIRGDDYTAITNPENDLSIHHSHPLDRPLSGPDLMALRHEGVRDVVAHTEQGNSTSASLTPEVKGFLKGKPEGDAHNELSELYQTAKVEIDSSLKRKVKEEGLSLEDVDDRKLEAVNRALHKAGVLDYHSTMDTERLGPDAAAMIDKAAKNVQDLMKEKGIENAGQERGDIGRYSPDQHGRPEGVAGPLPGAGSVGVQPEAVEAHRNGDAGASGNQQNVEQEPPLNLSPEHQAWQDLLGIPEKMTPSALGKVDKKLESIFSDTGDKGLPKASKLSDDDFNALEDYARRVETARNGPDAMVSDKDVAEHLSERGSIPFAPELRPEIKEFLDNIKRDILNFTTPMATGSARAQASAQNFMNSIRAGQWNATRLFHYLSDNFTPEDLKNMWEKMDEASVHVQQQEANGMSREAAMADAEKNGVGHFGLPEEQKNIISAMSKWAQAAWDSAKKADMVEGEGLPFWTPRMAAVIGEDGKWESPGAGEGKPTLNPVGKNLRTSSGNLKERKYLTAAETEAAMQAHFGEDSTALVRDIRAMPIALQRLNQAIAGRTLINEIKEFSSTAGGETVSAEAKDGYFTMDHPAFQSYRPKLEMGEDGKWNVAKDANGNELFEKTPLYIAKEFEGPLKAVLSQPSSAAYKALMEMKGKSMSMIMFSPFIHNLVEYGRALPAVPGKVWNTKIYFEGNAAKNDPVFMQRMIDHGFDPIGSRFFKQDISSVMEEPDLTPGKSWTAKLLGGLTTEVAGEGAGLKVKGAIDKMGDVWHNTLLWDRVADLQAGIAHNIEGDMLKNGFQPEAAATAAAHLANRYAGALPKESMGPLATKMANLLMFSRSFTVGNWGVMKDMFAGLPAGPKAQLMKDIGAEGAEEASDFVKRKARAAFMMDIGLKVVGLSIAQDTINHLKQDKSLGQILHGYVDRFDKLLQAHKEDPWEYLNPAGDIESLSSTAANEPGKQDRVRISEDSKTGTASYMRLPTGKIGEEMEGWITSPLEMMRKKQSTFLSPLVDIYKNEDYFGHPIYDKNARGISGAADSLGKAAMHIMKAQFPDDLLDSVYKTLTGTDRADNAEKTALSFLGLTMSKGYPGGPEAGILAEATRRHEGEISNSLPKIKAAVEGDDTDKARDMMTDLGMTPRQQTALIKHYKNPGAKVNAAALRTFERIASPDEKDLMDQQSSQ